MGGQKALRAGGGGRALPSGTRLGRAHFIPLRRRPPGFSLPLSRHVLACVFEHGERECLGETAV
jgi:hypothetical protein